MIVEMMTMIAVRVNIDSYSMSLVSNTIIIDTKYPVVKFVGKKIFKWALQYDNESLNWDMYWTDQAVPPE